MFVLKNIIFTDMTRTLPSINMAKIKGSYCYFLIFYIYEQKRPVFHLAISEGRIYKRKQEIGKKRKKAFLFFLVAFLVKSVFSFFFFLTVIVFS